MNRDREAALLQLERVRESHTLQMEELQRQIIGIDMMVAEKREEALERIDKIMQSVPSLKDNNHDKAEVPESDHAQKKMSRKGRQSRKTNEQQQAVSSQPRESDAASKEFVESEVAYTRAEYRMAFNELAGVLGKGLKPHEYVDHFHMYEEECFRIFRSIQITNDEAERTSEQYELLQAEFNAQYEAEAKANTAAENKINGFKARLESTRKKNSEVLLRLKTLRAMFLQISAVLKSIFNGLGCDTIQKPGDKLAGNGSGGGGGGQEE